MLIGFQIAFGIKNFLEGICGPLVLRSCNTTTFTMAAERHQGGEERGAKRHLLRNFSIGNPVGKGKFSIVYKAERKDNRSLRALKRVNLDVMDEGGAEACLQVKVQIERGCKRL